MAGKVFVELITEKAGIYNANVWVDGVKVTDMPKDLNFKIMREAIRFETGLEIPHKEFLRFNKVEDKHICHINNFIEGPATQWLDAEKLISLYK